MIRELLDTIASILRELVFMVIAFFTSASTTTIIFDNGISVTKERKIAEGGFSYIYSAHNSSFPSTKYALKRIVCPDREIVIACQNEAKVHQTLGNTNINLLPLIALKFDSSGPQNICYMLFPLITGGSLRDEVSKRMLLRENILETERRPFSEIQLLRIFKGILHGVVAMHDSGLAHCDIKLENVLLERKVMMIPDEENYATAELCTPILMDFGSARPLVVKLSDRRIVLNLTDEASRNSTVSYRAPELFDGGCRHGKDEPDIDGKVDVWSCGCLLYAMMYGASPFEMEFRNETPRIVECTYLRVLGGKIPVPPLNSAVGDRFSREIAELVRWILNVDRAKRPDMFTVLGKVEELLESGGSTNFRANNFTSGNHVNNIREFV